MRTEEYGALVVVHAVDFPAQPDKVNAYLGTDEAG